jgi:hypothetical protein
VNSDDVYAVLHVTCVSTASTRFFHRAAGETRSIEDLKLSGHEKAEYWSWAFAKVGGWSAATAGRHPYGRCDCRLTLDIRRPEATFS